MNIVQEILDKAIQNGEFSFLKKPIEQNIAKFYRQYIPYINKNGERIVEINAFCEILELPPSSESKTQEWTKMDWKNTYVIVNDGGSCYWRITINLDKREYIDLMVNGEA